MLSNRLAFIVLGATCVAAAAAGGYLANRQNTAVVAQPSAAESIEQAVPQPVVETENVVADSNPAPRPEPTTRAENVEPAATSSPPPAVRRPRQTRPPVAQARTQAAQRPPAADRRGTPEPAPSAPVLPEATEPSPLPSVEWPEPPPVPTPVFHELTVAADSVLGLQIETTISSDRARIEDRVDGRVVRDVRVGGDVAIPAGSRVIGSVTLVEPGGKFKERARLGIRFHTLVLADGERIPVTTETIYRYGDPPGNNSAAKIGGGAVAGAILGAILGGAKGAAVGATAGAGGGTAAVVAGDRSEAVFLAGSELTARFLAPVTVMLER